MGVLGIRSLIGLAREVRAPSGEAKPLVLAGASELVPLLAKELRVGGDASAVVENGPYERAAGLVWLGSPDEHALRTAARAGIPIVALSDAYGISYVLDSDVVLLEPGKGLPVQALARTVARVIAADRVALAARLPVLRAAVIGELVESCARQNGLIAAATFVPGADLPALTLNELRLVLQVALASGASPGLRQAPELLAVIGTAFGSRRLTRRLGEFVPAGFALKGAVAYGATKALGEAARARFA